MLDKHFNILRSAFIEAMYFADGAEPEMVNDEGHYLDGQFSKYAELTDRANQNINDLLKKMYGANRREIHARDNGPYKLVAVRP